MVTVKINGTDYTSYFYVGEFGDFDHTYIIGYANLVFRDESDTISTLLRASGKKRVEILNGVTAVFTGVVEDWNPMENNLLHMYCIDLSIQLHGKPITKYDMASQTASTAISDLISTHGDGLFTTDVDATTTTYDDIFYYMTALEIMQELALREGYYIKLTPSLQWKFKPRSSNDLGITYSEGTDFYAPNFPKISHRIRNGLLAIDSSGQAYAKFDLSSINDHFVRMGFEDVPDATSETHIRNHLNARIGRDSGQLTPGSIKVQQDFTLEATGLIRINYAKLGWVNEQAYILGVVQDLDKPSSRIELVNYRPEYDEAISKILYDRRQLQKRNIDTSLALIILADIEVEVGVKNTVVVERQDSVVDIWDEGVFDSAKWDSQPDVWDEIVSETTMVVTNTYLNRIRDLVQGEAVNALDAANAKIALGSGTTVAKVTDTALASEISGTNKAVDAGYPRDGSDGEAEHQSSVQDSDVSTFTAWEVGLFEGSSLMARVVLGTSFSKLANQTIRVRVKTVFSDVSPTVLMTRFLNKLRDILQGKAVTALDAANTKIQYGTGTTAVTATDTDLAVPVAATLKSMDSGFPQDNTATGMGDWQASITDADTASMSAREIGMKEGSNLLLRKILDSALAKASGEIVRTRVTLKFKEEN